ncbi:hypothetical protein TTHERM_00185920 (macronuclear) [Tetrahymena thermophila SB210]|uniref:Uncharacterized protein n=1 Tax=Tetrahymena thermophila (strain SB210) TaxID=312017 RepID=Q22T20_TETTS|nr:hypothetical protein TTHERM_00185920 [Tetrahymena thermophila SB210]EAR88618.2 hypothetical protein TTHERM_00185920 [Tetrahymena thermophila SB210]|eukprot:XP_001008863.2 hypothetical protein TTHERM_00185920 [Tetrahymena thermophila SB210]
MSQYDVKLNMSKVVLENGYLEQKRVEKVNTQLGYQPINIKFDKQDSPSGSQESEEYNRILKQQRDLDQKSQQILTNSMRIFSDSSSFDNYLRKQSFWVQSQTKQNEEERKKSSVNLELKKKNFLFGSSQQAQEGDFQNINLRSSSREDEIQLVTNIEIEQKSNVNQQQANKEKEQKQEDRKEDQPKFDFHNINTKVQSKKRENITSKQIGDLPRDIEEILKLQADELNNGFYNQNEKLERNKINLVQGDLIEAYSLAYIFPVNNIQKNTHNACFFRDLAPISRFLMKYSNLPQYSELKQQNKGDDASNFELIQYDEISFRINSLEFNNLANIISGRIGDESISKLDTTISNVQDFPVDIQKRVEELVQAQLEAKLSTLQLTNQQNSNNNNNNSNQEQEQKKKQTQQQQTQDNQQSGQTKEQIKNSFKQKASQDQQVQIDQPLNQAATTPRSFLGMNENQIQRLSPEQQKLQQQISALHNQTDQILNRIAEIKAKKEQMKFIKDNQEYLQKYKEIQKELQQALNGLLFMILKSDKNPNPQINVKYSELSSQLSELLKNLDQIQGSRTSDGHLKTSLILTFLEEYKWLNQEDKLHKMDFESNNKKPQQKIQTFANYIHSGSQNKQSSKSTNMNNSGLNLSRQQEPVNYTQVNQTAQFIPANPKNSKSVAAGVKQSTKENFSNLQNENRRQNNQFKNENAVSQRNNLSPWGNNQSYSPQPNSYLGAIDTTNSYYQQTPIKSSFNNNLTDRSFTPNQTSRSNLSKSSVMQNKSQSSVSNFRQQIKQNKSVHNTSFNKSSKKLDSKENNFSRSISPIIYKKSQSRAEQEYSDSKPKYLKQQSISGIKKGQLSNLNRSYNFKDSSFYQDDSNAKTSRK